MAYIDYEKQIWKNSGETGAIPINATNLNHIENGLDRLSKTIGRISVAKCDSQTITLESSTITQIPLSGFNINAYSMFSISDGGIYCPVTGYTLVCGNVYFNASGGTTQAVYVYKNGAEVISQTTNARAYAALSSGMTIIPVQDGDIISMHARCNGGAGSVDGTNIATQLIAVYV